VEEAKAYYGLRSQGRREREFSDIALGYGLDDRGFESR
jgi:hypothetical protein